MNINVYLFYKRLGVILPWDFERESGMIVKVSEKVSQRNALWEKSSLEQKKGVFYSETDFSETWGKSFSEKWHSETVYYGIFPARAVLRETAIF